MTCMDCEAASRRVWALFTAGCPECQARAAARSHAALKRRSMDILTPGYTDMLLRMGLTDEQVQAAAKKDFQCRGKA